MSFLNDLFLICETYCTLSSIEDLMQEINGLFEASGFLKKGQEQ